MAFVNSVNRARRELVQILDKNQMGMKDFWDNFAWNTPVSYAKNGPSPYHYFFNEPTQIDLYKLSRLSEIAFRLVWGFAKDIWSNSFRIKFENILPEESRIKNDVLKKHLTSINFFEEMFRLTGFDREQGEAILVIHRRGNTFKSLEERANERLNVVRVEAVNAMDYNILNTGDHGAPTGYRVNFYEEGIGKPSYLVEPSNALRLRSLPLEYDIYRSQSSLKACFSTINIIESLVKNAGDFAFRIGTGRPTIFTQNVRTQDEADKLASVIGNPTAQDWMMVPNELVKSIQMLGAEGNVQNLLQLFELCINLVAFYSKMPKSMLIGDAVGVIEGSRVYERAYYAVLTEYQSFLIPFMEKYFSIDPICQRILGSHRYSIDFGLRQAMSDTDAAQIKAMKIANAISMMPMATFDEVRIAMELDTWANSYKGNQEIHELLYGMPPEELGSMPAQTVNVLFSLVSMASQETETPNQKTRRKNPKNPPKQNDPDSDDLDNETDEEKAQKEVNKLRKALLRTDKLITPQVLGDMLGVSRQTAINMKNKAKQEIQI